MLALKLENAPPMTELDGPDLKILEALQVDNMISAEKLGREIGLSQSVVQRRSKRLRDAGVIAADVAVLDPKALGFGMTLIVEVSLDRESSLLFENFKKRMLAAREVQQCYYTTGDGDFVLIILARDMADYEEISERLFFNDPNIRRFRTSVVMSRIKATLALPIPAAP